VLTKVVVATAKVATATMIIWAAIEIPTLLVAAVAIIPAPVAADVPADEVFWTAIDWRVELKLCSTGTLNWTMIIRFQRT
jgi:hypothetical protein